MIFHYGQPIIGDYKKIYEEMISTSPLGKLASVASFKVQPSI